MTYATGERVDFNYTTEATEKKPSKTIHVVGTVTKPSGNVKPETALTTIYISLDTPRDGRDFIACKIKGITPSEKFELTSEPKPSKKRKS
jgi:hypothetical protein